MEGNAGQHKVTMATMAYIQTLFMDLWTRPLER
jgi:hypothetical protein